MNDKTLDTDPARSALMARIRQTNTKPEILVGHTLRMFGLRYRKNVRGLPGRPDFANRFRKWAVFVNGCYWHHHHCKRGTIPVRNREFWVAKFAANRARDAMVVRRLRALGYCVVLVWECEAIDSDRLAKRLTALATISRQRALPSTNMRVTPQPLEMSNQQPHRGEPSPQK